MSATLVGTRYCSRRQNGTRSPASGRTEETDAWIRNQDGTQSRPITQKTFPAPPPALHGPEQEPSGSEQPAVQTCLAEARGMPAGTPGHVCGPSSEAAPLLSLRVWGKTRWGWGWAGLAP